MKKSRLATAIYRGLYGCVAIPLVLALLLADARLWMTARDATRHDLAAKDDLVRRLTFLEHALENGAGERMQEIFPEGFLFLHALYGVSWVDVSLRHGGSDPALAARALAAARWARSRIESPRGRAPFEASLVPPYGMFFTSWSSLVQAGIVLASGEHASPDDLDALERDCDAIEAALAPRRTPFPPSYPDAAWPADSFPGQIALRVCDERIAPRHVETRAWWVSAARARVDRATGLLTHSCNAVNGDPELRPRGSSQALMLRFLPDIDAAFAAEQYARFRAAFVATRAGLPAVLEYQVGSQGRSDVDSGPLPLGVSLPGSAVAIGAALRNGDAALARVLGVESEAFGLPLALGGTKRHLLGSMPIGDAFVTWSWTATPWFGPPSDPPSSFPPVERWWWRVPFLLLTLPLSILILWPLTFEVHDVSSGVCSRPPPRPK